ncbi:MAG: RNase P subunit p30 family protein [Candidatus Diapherotrites archaeon]
MEKNQILLTETNFSRLKDRIKKEKLGEKKIIYSSEDDELNRKVVEKLPVNILLINLSGRKDFQKQRNSGLNQVLAKAMKKKDIQLGINFDEIIEKKNLKKKSEILARLKQNIFLCNKNKIKMRFIAQKEENNRNNYDLKSLGLVLGIPTWMTSQV